MAKFRVYGNRTDEVTELEKENRLLARQLAEEGIVLLENDGVLPLGKGNVALYGGGARLTVKGGSGSGDVRERYSVNIEDGLKNSGFRIVGTSWLERFTATYERDKQEFREKVEKAIKGYPVWKVMAMFQKIGEFHLAYPVGDDIRDTDLSDETDTCIYVIARQAGEGADRKREKGDYLLSDLEASNLKKCREHYRKLIVVLNCGSSLDLSPLKEIRPNALLFYGQAGEEGGNALGRILSGEVTPSGKLTDTWAENYEDYPVARIAHPEKLEENYEEGIYVGYRWFDASGIRPMYPFGHGLSYTGFRHSCLKAEAEGSKVKLTVEVENTGKAPGKEVVFAFVYKPNKKMAGEVKSLAAFAKTELLQAGGKQTVELRFDLRDHASYDEENSCWFLEEGIYGVSVGTDAEHCEPVTALHVARDTVTEQCRTCCPKQMPFEDWSIRTEGPDCTGLPVLEIRAESVTNDYTYRLPEVSETVKHYLDTLTDEELAMYTMGGGYFNPTYIKVLGSCGNTTSLLLKKGIPCIIMTDGPAGINIMPKSAYTRRGGTRYIDELPQEWQWGWLKTVVARIPFLYAGKKDIRCYQYCTALPNATTVGQTFNTALVEKAGEGVGKEMLVMGVTLWLAPALNIHRDPLCGRNFEYYSEDPVVSGEMAAAITRGVQKNKGVGVTVKHFACNNREDDRTTVSSNLSEKALREIYLKGFRIVCREQPMALMTSYNRINGTYSANSRELLTDILRCEWGYEGLVMSDWDGVDRGSYTEAVKCGNNMIMPGRKDIYEKICKALKDGELTREDLRVSALYGLKLVFDAKTTQDFLHEQR